MMHLRPPGEIKANAEALHHEYLRYMLEREAEHKEHLKRMKEMDRKIEADHLEHLKTMDKI